MKAKTEKRNGKGLTRVIRAAICSFDGFKTVWTSESAFRQELFIVIILLPVSFYIAKSIGHWAALVSTLAVLLITEILNSGIEVLADRITLEDDLMIKQAKDMGSSAVFIALSLVIMVWGGSIIQFLS